MYLELFFLSLVSQPYSDMFWVPFGWICFLGLQMVTLMMDSMIELMITE